MKKFKHTIMPIHHDGRQKQNPSAPRLLSPDSPTASGGFSLVELLVVIAIMAILSVTAYTAFGGQTVKARDAKRVQDMDTIQGALQVYYVNMGSYPTALVSGTNQGEIPKSYLSSIPKDPGSAKHDYAYAVSGNSYELGATLEGDGIVDNYEAYVVGNSDTALIQSDGSTLGFYSNGTALVACNASVDIVSGTIGSAATGPCVPYDPNN